jgi:hypothetical protein
MTDYKPIYDILDSIELPHYPDAISYPVTGEDGFEYAINAIRDRIEQLDEEETKDYLKDNSAHWIISCDGYYPYCSACGYQPEGKPTKFCAECGKIMVEVK